ncbi:MAG: hypothetical protein ABR511_12350 [Acidimicrobiales bacterium]
MMGVMDDLGRAIREQVEAAVAKALRDAGTATSTASASSSRGTNVVVSANVVSQGHSTSVYSDDEVTIVERDGVTEVIRHQPGEGRGQAWPWARRSGGGSGHRGGPGPLSSFSDMNTRFDFLGNQLVEVVPHEVQQAGGSGHDTMHEDSREQ